MNLGDFSPSSSVTHKFLTAVWGTGVPSTLSAATVSVYKDSGSSPSSAGTTLTPDFNSTTGLNHLAINLSADLTFYSSGSDFQVVVTGTVNSSAIMFVVASFSIRNRVVKLAGGVAHGDSTSTLMMESMSVTNPSGDAVVFAGGATGTGFRSAGGASGDGIRLVGGSVVGYPVRFSHTSTPDGSDVLGQLGPNVLDLVHLVAPTGPATEFVEAMTQLYYREFPPGPGGETFKSTSDHTVRTRDSFGNVITTQPYTDDNAGNESLGPPS